ncbi:hypothetical protein [Bradyrhizobium roseum]|uniref:hypothetical protein n=1 Tax=Bradyrhizobium roseum TaxID=3056648 RepID=UPI0026092437|nr:hypothetical protein [Bradyrhizobium roseus]WKA26365.1 hypothetical protein QUH67_22510 [Bradyrhizobium roseus]
MSDEVKVMASIPSWDALDKRFEPYAIQLGWLAYSWNKLHERLSDIFWALTGIQNGYIPAAIWNAVKNDRTQREMLKGLASATLTDRKDLLEEILWVLKQADKFEDKRNDALHSPLIFMIEKDGPRLSSSHHMGNPRALKLKDKDLLNEFKWYGETANVLASYLPTLTRCIRSPNHPFERPTLPALGVS